MAANLVAAVLSANIAECGPVLIPDQDREFLAGLWLVQIDQGRLSAASARLVNTGHQAANRGGLADMARGFRGWDVIGAE